MKLVINRCFGGFSLSRKAAEWLRDRGHPLAVEELGNGPPGDSFMDNTWLYRADRDDPLIVAVVEELGEDADGACAKLAVVEIPDGVEWEIEEYDGKEHVAEKHRTWY